MIFLSCEKVPLLFEKSEKKKKISCLFSFFFPPVLLGGKKKEKRQERMIYSLNFSNFQIFLVKFLVKFPVFSSSSNKGCPKGGAC